MVYCFFLPSPWRIASCSFNWLFSCINLMQFAQISAFFTSTSLFAVGLSTLSPRLRRNIVSIEKWGTIRSTISPREFPASKMFSCNLHLSLQVSKLKSSTFWTLYRYLHEHWDLPKVSFDFLSPSLFMVNKYQVLNRLNKGGYDTHLS